MRSTPLVLFLAGAMSAAGTLLAASPAYAGDEPAAEPDLGPDEIQLKSGGMVRGTVVSLEPGREVVIQIHGRAEPRVIPWEEVADVQRGKYEPAPEEPPAVEEPVDVVTAPPESGDDDVELSASERGMVRLHIDSDDPAVELHEVLGMSTGMSSGAGGSRVFVVGHTRSVCAAPCDRVIDARDGRKFFFSGDGIPASDAFSLTDRQGDVTARVDAGDMGLGIGGYIVTSLGVAGVVYGATMTGLAYGLDDAGSGFFDSHKVAGPVVLGTGALFLAGGITMMVFAGTDYELEQGPTRQGRPARWWRGEF